MTTGHQGSYIIQGPYNNFGEEIKFEKMANHHQIAKFYNGCDASFVILPQQTLQSVLFIPALLWTVHNLLVMVQYIVYHDIPSCDNYIVTKA